MCQIPYRSSRARSRFALKEIPSPVDAAAVNSCTARTATRGSMGLDRPRAQDIRRTRTAASAGTLEAQRNRRYSGWIVLEVVLSLRVIIAFAW